MAEIIKGSTYYKLNIIGFKLSDEQLQTIPLPHAELGTHITLRTTQAFGILGAGAGAATSAIQGNRDLQSMSNKGFAFGQYGVIAGLITGPVLTAVFSRGKTRDSMVDRCYRLRLNKHQCRVDRLAGFGLYIGAGAAYYCGGMIDKGAFYGFTGGVVLAAVLNQIC